MIRRTHPLLSLRILFFGVCLHWFWKQRHHSHPFVQQQLLGSCDLSSNLIGRPVLSQSDGGKNPCFFTPWMIAPGVNSLIGIDCFDSKVSSHRTFASNFHVQCEKAFSGAALCFICRLVCSPDSCLIWIVGLAPAAALALWGDEACRPLGDADWTIVCCALGICRIWDGELTRALGDGKRVEATFTAADEPPEPHTHINILKQTLKHTLPHTVRI